MSKTLTGSIQVSVGMNYENAVGGDVQESKLALAKKLSQAIASGVGLNQGDVLWLSENRALTSGGTEDLDLFDGAAVDVGAGAGKDPLGIALANARIKALIILNQPSSAGTLQVGALGASTGWNTPWCNSSAGTTNNAGNNIPPGGMLVITAPTAAGFVVTDTSNHLLHVKANGGACTYSIYYVGASA